MAFWNRPQKTESPAGRVLALPVDAIMPNPDQPRKRYAKEELEALAASIRENGLLQPITVRESDPGAGRPYTLIAGHRRWLAVRLLGEAEVPALVCSRTQTEAAVLALVENLQRADLGPMEEAEAIDALIRSTGLSQQETARRLGKSQSAIANKLRLLKLPGWVREEVEVLGLTERHARALLPLSEDEQFRRVLGILREKKCTVSETEALVARLLAPKKCRPKRKLLLRDYRILRNTIEKAVSAMASAGIPVETKEEEDGDSIVYTIRVPCARPHTR